jgi:hypothetical protein
MIQRRVLAQVSMLALSLCLAGCGGDSSGGGIASTPTPAPTPAPTPTPTPTPPPPTTANADLITLGQSETFTNDSRTGAVSYPKAAGSFSASATAGTVNIVYDATSQTYTLTSGGRTQSFAPGDLDAASSTGTFRVFKKVNGTTTDTLSLTRPGTAGSQYRYVGGAFWQRTVDGTATISGDFDAVAYGVETLDSAIVRTGGANYATTLNGVVARPDALYSMVGEATLTLNFLTGSLSGRSLVNGVRETRVDTLTPGRSSEWGFTGTLSGTTNAITGTTTLGVASSDPLTGSASGRLYGPASDELGIAFQASGADGSRAVGTILGRKSSSVITGTNPSLTNLQFNETFARASSGSTGWSAASSAGVPTVFSNDYFIQPSGYELRYNATAQNFALFDAGTFPNTQIISTTGTTDASLTDSRFLGYSNSTTDSVARLKMYRVGSGNSEIALTYSSFYNLEYVSRLPGTSFWSLKSFWTPYGVTTPNASMPTTGTATYNGFLNGNAIDGNIGDPIAKVGGTVAVALNFGTAAVTGTIRPIITYQSGVTYDFGTLSLFNGSYSNPGVNVQGVVGPPVANAIFGYQNSFGTGPNGPLWNGTLNGTFYGPVGQELTGRFEAQYIPRGTNGVSGRMWGAFATTKAP